MDEAQARQELVGVCHKVHDRGMVSGSGGNISVRIGDHVLITPTGRALGALKPEELVKTDLQGNVLGPGKPSKEHYLHLACYLERPEITTVVHVHSVYAVAVSCLRNLDFSVTMPVYTPGYRVRVGHLPCVSYYKPGSPELARSVREVIKTRNSVLLANHGVVTVGTALEEALNIAEEIEENAHLTLLLGERGRPLDV